MAGDAGDEVRSSHYVPTDPKQRKAPKKGARKRNTRSRVKKEESGDESEADSYFTDDGDVVYDCI
jgi:hypothetical protein